MAAHSLHRDPVGQTVLFVRAACITQDRLRTIPGSAGRQALRVCEQRLDGADGAISQPRILSEKRRELGQHFIRGDNSVRRNRTTDSQSQFIRRIIDIR